MGYAITRRCYLKGLWFCDGYVWDGQGWTDDLSRAQSFPTLDAAMDAQDDLIRTRKTMAVAVVHSLPLDNYFALCREDMARISREEREVRRAMGY